MSTRAYPEDHPYPVSKLPFLAAGSTHKTVRLFLRSFINPIYLHARSLEVNSVLPSSKLISPVSSFLSQPYFASMASFSSSHKQGEDRPVFSGIEPPNKRRKVSESSRLYDVFINHRGPDVKNTLALQLYNFLQNLEIQAFLDSEEKELGVSFPSTIETAIRSAAVHIAIFSKGYAESPWCLAELVLMLQSSAKIIPVFNDVEPSALGHIEKGVYGKAFSEYESKKRYTEKLEEWKQALQSISFIAGEKFNRDYEKMVLAVQKEVQRRRFLHVAKYPVGLSKLVEHFERHCIDKLVQDFETQFEMNEQGEVKSKIVGIFGMGGVGKTTLSKELFNRKRSDYSRSCFLFDVREAPVKKDLHSLQMKLLRELFDERDRPSFSSVEDGTSCLSNHFTGSGNPNFLIVLDDINHQEQLDALLVSDELNNSSNSLVIVTTRDVGVLINAGITVGYHLKGMDTDDAKELFCWHAFSQPYPSSGYEKLVDLFVDVCGGLPLSLQVLGKHVHGEDQKFWELELNKVTKTLPQDIHKRLRISIEMLDNEEKQIFMDVACFFIGELTKDAIRAWEGSGWSAQHALLRLKNKCLVEEIKDYKFRGQFEDLFEDSREEMLVLRMHDHLRDLGREMADELSHPRRLWRSQHLQSLKSKGYENILTKANFRCLHSFSDASMGFTIKYFLEESDNIVETSTALLWLELNYWTHTLPSIPPWIPLQNLQYLQIRGGGLESLWQNDVQVPFQFKELRIYHQWELKKLSLGFLRFLEEITIHDCKNLKSVTGISDLRKLVELNIGLSGLSKLVELNINSCQKVEELCLVQLSRLEFCLISDLLTLKRFEVKGCKNLVTINGIFWNPVKLNIYGCPKLEKIPDIVKLHSLERMQLLYCSNETIRNCILNMEKLPSSSIKVIDRAVDGAESILNANLFCDFIRANSIIEIGTDNACNCLSRCTVKAIILCALVVVNTPTAAETINDFIYECDINPWLKFEVRHGEWIITSVTTNQDEINSYIASKGYCFPFDYLGSLEDVMVKGVTIPVMKDEEHNILKVSRIILYKLYQT
ncbi:disease resistance protein Roq1-like [Cryptomeria japonica]|uniref:disease resistance protein Roq1-like n=1 Tax=Cryptomeria japonica TaxID=3369 RepID=UPI0027DA6D29|nr:disease resistance protein Roq1-like [Cryptomeria japonica]